MARASLFLLAFFSIFSSSFSVSALGDDRLVTAPVAAPTAATGYIVSVDLPKGEQLEYFAIRTLANVLKSEEAAKESLLHLYYNVFSGFAANLTPEQASTLKSRQILKSLLAIIFFD
ncbi:hypothetical protein Cni_G11054 [Canna indica]|uniref:Inhibitor I9 domain-containing protein n=1 Tax=Canna indica TaxID=4628 RepID=A0AAQ3K5K9_9LILI|nr:hypothetical protein Cni_G11054 [Canna indica]